MSRIGKILCLIYASIGIAFFAVAYYVEGGSKGQYVVLQLPLALQMAGIDAMGLSSKVQIYRELVLMHFRGYYIFALVFREFDY